MVYDDLDANAIARWEAHLLNSDYRLLSPGEPLKDGDVSYDAYKDKWFPIANPAGITIQPTFCLCARYECPFLDITPTAEPDVDWNQFNTQPEKERTEGDKLMDFFFGNK